MFCSQCGTDIATARFCSSCGAAGAATTSTETEDAIETIRISPKAKFRGGVRTKSLQVLGGDFKTGDWQLSYEFLIPTWGLKKIKLTSKTVDRIEIVKDAHTLQSVSAEEGFALGWLAGGVVGAVIGDYLSQAIKKEGSIIKLYFSDGKTMIAFAEGNTMAALYGAAE